MATTLSATAAFYWAGIAYGILSPRQAIAWADTLIAAGAEVPADLYELSLSPPGDSKRLVATLRALHAEEDVTDATVRGLLGILSRRLRTGEISPATAIELGYSVTRRLSADSPLWLEAMILEENYSLAVDRIVGEVRDLDAEVVSWLARFEGEAAQFDSRAG